LCELSGRVSKIESTIGSPISLVEIDEQLSEALVSSSRQMGWKGILVEHYRHAEEPGELELPALPDHWLTLPLGQPAHLTQKRDGTLHESAVQKGDIICFPAGRSSYWQIEGRVSNDFDYQPMLHIQLQSRLVTHVAEKLELGQGRVELVNCFSNHDLPLHNIAMLLAAEVETGGLMGELYRESLTQAFVVYLLRNYSTIDREIKPQHQRLTNTQLQQSIDYIHDHLGGDLSLIRIAETINISPTYFASLFKQKTGISPHQYVIQQRVDRAIVLLQTKDLRIGEIATQVGFSSQSHLTQHTKRATGMTPKQIAKIRRS
jgi:AraC family transcriptional regulator